VPARPLERVSEPLSSPAKRPRVGAATPEEEISLAFGYYRRDWYGTWNERCFSKVPMEPYGPMAGLRCSLKFRYVRRSL
jgi:hypothetical protein